MLPVLRLFFACQSDTPGVPVLAHTVGDLALAVRPGAGQGYPLTFPNGFWVYAVLTGGRGRYTVQVRLSAAVAGATPLDWWSVPGTIDLGIDPLAVTISPFQLPDIMFPAPGQYELTLVCDGIDLGPTFYLEASA